MAKAPTLAEQLLDLPNSTAPTWDKLTDEQQKQLEEMIKVYWNLPVGKRKPHRNIAAMLTKELGVNVSRSTLSDWLNKRKPGG